MTAFATGAGSGANLSISECTNRWAGGERQAAYTGHHTVGGGGHLAVRIRALGDTITCRSRSRCVLPKETKLTDVGVVEAGEDAELPVAVPLLNWKRFASEDSWQPKTAPATLH